MQAPVRLDLLQLQETDCDPSPDKNPLVIQPSPFIVLNLKEADIARMRTQRIRTETERGIELKVSND